ncbi:hypothetical protein [Pantoea sp. KPR_PJ]|uniref:hypothetical protein n=1 Tax=Pantoea sp. KPR_PJ TaxID=2738375 RepID=UPI003528CC0C
MRELNLDEVLAVSGCGVIKDITTGLGQMAGSFVGTAIGGLVPLPLLSGFISKATSSLLGYLGSLLGSWVGDLVEGNNTGSLSS